MPKTKKTAWGMAVNFLASLKLSIFLFLALAATSALGTLIQQKRNISVYISSHGPTAAKIIKYLQLGDMYHSWWFQLLLVLLVNTLVCSMRRLPAALRQMARNQFLDTSQLAKKKLRTVWAAEEGKEQLIEDVLKKSFTAASKQGGQRPDELRWFAQKQRWARLGPYIAHVSLALFFIGGLVSAQYSIKGFVNIMEGDATSEIRLSRGGTMELPFEVACTKFELQKYPDGRPSDYLSHLEVRRGGELTQSKITEVNDPLIVDGMFFYQSNYGGSDGGAFLTVLDRKGNTLIKPTVIAEEGMRKLPGSELSLEVLSTVEEFKNLGPAAQLTLVSTKDGGHVHVGDPFIVFQRLPDYDKRRNADYVVQLTELKPPKRYTGLQVAKDPGVPFIWGGSLLMILGTLLCSFASHRRIWISLEGGQLTVAGFAAKNKQGFKEQFEKLTALLRDATEAKPTQGHATISDT